MEYAHIEVCKTVLKLAVSVAYLVFQILQRDGGSEAVITEGHFRHHPRLLGVEEEVDGQVGPSIRQLDK